MPQDWKETFGELRALDSVMNGWGENARKNISKPVALVAGLAALFNQRVLRHDDYTAIDHGAYHRLREKGPEEKGFEASAKILARSLAYMDSNAGMVMHFLSAKKTRKLAPAVADPARLRALAEKHGLNNLKKMLPR